MIKGHKASWWAVYVLTLTGCHAMPTGLDQPARIINPDEASRAGLRSALIEALGVAVMVSDTALTDSSLLVIENQPPATMENPVPMGRVMEMPFRFRLVKNAEQCILINQQEQKRYILNETTCTPE